MKFSNSIAAKAVLFFMLLLGVGWISVWSQSTLQSDLWLADTEYFSVAGNHNLTSLPQPGVFNFTDLEYTGQQADYCHNIMQDRDGALLFFVIDHRVYDKNGNIIDLFPVQGSYLCQEALVFPNPNTCDEYFVVITATGNHTPDLHWMSINTSTSTPTVINSGSHALRSYYRFSDRAARLAVTEAVDDSDPAQRKTRYLYGCAGYHYTQFKTSGSSINHVNDFGINFTASMGGGYYDDDYRAEMELISVDQGNIQFLLAFPYWSLHGGGGTVNRPAITIIELDANGFPPAATWNGLWTAHGDEVLMQDDDDWPKGLEFTPDGNHLVFTATKAPYVRYIDVNNTGAGWTDVNSLPYVNISNPQDYSLGMIERDRNGRLWFAGDNNRLTTLNSLHWHNPTYWYYNNNSVANLTLPLTDGNLGSNPRSEMYILQDQVDGEDYENKDPWGVISTLYGLVNIGGTNCGKTHTYQASVNVAGGTPDWLSPVIDIPGLPYYGTYTPPTISNYQNLTFTYDLNGCTYSKDLRVHVGCNGFGEEEEGGLGGGKTHVNGSLTQDITVFPNPANTSITLKGLTQNTAVAIVDMMGRTVYSGMNGDGAQVDVSNFTPGLYLVKFSDQTGTEITKRLIIQ